MHGKEEAQLVLEDWFDNKKETGQESTQTGTAEVEDMAIPKKKVLHIIGSWIIQF